MREIIAGWGNSELYRRTKWSLLLVCIGTNVAGACVALALSVWVLPAAALVDDEPEVLRRNGIVFVVYLATAVTIGVIWGIWQMRPTDPADDSEPTSDEYRKRSRDLVLRGPVRLLGVQTALWLAAVAVFGGANLFFSVPLAGMVVAVIGIGGVTTMAVSYRLTQRVLRREVVRVLEFDPPISSLSSGVALRSIGSWLMGTAVPLLGLCLAAVVALGFPEHYNLRRLAVIVLVLSGFTLLIGGFLNVLTAFAVAAPVASVRRALENVRLGDFSVRVPIYDASELGLLQAGFNVMAAGLDERERIRDLFGRHVGQDVARAALAADVSELTGILGGEVRDLAVLFVDVIGSTRLAAERPPQAVVALLNSFFAVVVEVAEEHSGWVNKFQGDAALIVFGTPNALASPATNALRAARDLARRLPEEVAGLAAGIGVSAGPSVAGNIGAPQRYEYTVIGDPVNEAARLTELAKNPSYGGVIGSGSALDRADRAEVGLWRATGTTTLRGRNRPTELFVVKAVGGAEPTTRPPGPR